MQSFAATRKTRQPGKLDNAFKEANSTQQYPTVPNSTQQYPTVPNSIQQYATVSNSTPPGLAEVFVLLCRYTFPRLAAHRPWQHTAPGTGVVYFPRQAAHRPWQHTGPGNTQALAAHRPWHWSCILSPARQHTGPGSTQALQHTGPRSTQALAAHRP